MTTFLTLDNTTSFPLSPAFLVASPDQEGHVKRVVQAVLKARRIVVVCDAGISVQAGIPDFRSSDGLFQSLKKGYPRIVSGKDLFDISVFRSQDTTSLFCQMIAELSQLSDVAEPTAFHRLLQALDDRRSLLRVYTQNIDALEEKAGLTFGIPDAEIKGKKRRSGKAKAPTATTEAPPTNICPPNDSTASQLPPPLKETPKCIPLHGTLRLMHCVTCAHSCPLRDYIDSLVSGVLPPCPECTALEQTRQLVGKRPHDVGYMRPSIVLYNEDHKDGENMGNVVWKDLLGSSLGESGAGADVLLVVGTSLRVPGTKLIVRKFSKAVRSLHAATDSTPSLLADEPAVSTQGPMVPSSPPRRSTMRQKEPPVQTIYLNLDFPAPASRWEGVFDVCIRGDAQAFARLVHEELEKEKQVKEPEMVKEPEVVKERKRKREETAVEKTRGK